MPELRSPDEWDFTRSWPRNLRPRARGAVQDNDLTARQARSVYNQLGIQPDTGQERSQVDLSPARTVADLFGARDRPSVQQAVEKAKSQYPDLDEVLPHGGAGGFG